jgi:hypothetical protein
MTNRDERAILVTALQRAGLEAAIDESGAMILFQDGLLFYRWACPYRWLDVAQLESAVPAQAALDAFMRWRRG